MLHVCSKSSFSQGSTYYLSWKDTLAMRHSTAAKGVERQNLIDFKCLQK